MVALLVNGKKVNCPVCWEQVTTEQFERIKAVKEKDLLKLFSAVLGVEYEVIASDNSEEVEVTLYQVASFVINEPEYFRNYIIPSEFSVKGYEAVKIPHKLERMTVEQNMILKKAMEEENAVYETIISLACAVYLQPLLTKKPFHVELMEEVREKIKKMPIEDTFPLGFFLLKRQRLFGINGYLQFLRVRINRMIFGLSTLN